ncbi:hypothetical protein VTO58DRAFT_102557 [Aureobasidium pullulans]
MRTSVVGLFALPATLFFVIFTPVNGQDWPYNLPAGAKYYPEHEHHIRRDLEIQQRLNVASPSGIRKMSEDEGEKFFLDYWQFGEQDPNSFEIGSPLSLRRVYASTATTTTTLPTITVTTGASWSTLSDSTTTQTIVVPGNPTSQTASIYDNNNPWLECVNDVVKPNNTNQPFIFRPGPIDV